MIAIDEFQTMSGDRNANHAKLLNKIHGGGYPAPIFVIATGLSDTLGVVERMGISRTKLNAVHSLGALSEEESRALIEVGLNISRFPLDHGRMICWTWRERGVFGPLIFTTHSSHLRNRFVMLRVILKIDMAAVRVESQRRRETYYSARISSEFGRSKQLITAVMENFEDGMSGSDVIDLIEGSVRNSGTAAERLPAHMTAETYYDHLLHRGIYRRMGSHGPLSVLFRRCDGGSSTRCPHRSKL